MSSFLVGIIEQNVRRIGNDGRYSRIFDICLNKIQRIGIDQELTILMGGNAPQYAFDDIKECIPIHLQGDNISRFMIVRSPEDNFSDELFGDWEYEAWLENYLPGQAKVFKELENFIAQVFALNEIKSLWLRYQSMQTCEVNKLNAAVDLEVKLYEQCRNSSTFEISDFEINMMKE